MGRLLGLGSLRKIINNKKRIFCPAGYLLHILFILCIDDLALLHRYLIDAYFIKPVYKLLLKLPLTLNDLQYVDQQVYNSMCWIRDNEIDGVLDMNFTVLEERFGITEEKG